LRHRCIDFGMHPLSSTLAPMTVLTLDARPVALGSLWKDRPQVIVWLRHFG
jgi:hypothetical protein